ncbi:hypothetical protein BC477_13885 [Clavibacter michiganensis subsp. michiganensis]|nr:hypothetical protein BC477_13885 [Clavibacter michiganensis subsp. michiganensis]
MSKMRCGSRPTSRRQARSWLAACSTHSTSRITASSSEKPPTAGGSKRNVPAPRRNTWMRYARWL